MIYLFHFRLKYLLCYEGTPTPQDATSATNWCYDTTSKPLQWWVYLLIGLGGACFLGGLIFASLSFRGNKRAPAGPMGKEAAVGEEAVEGEYEEDAEEVLNYQSVVFHGSHQFILILRERRQPREKLQARRRL